MIINNLKNFFSSDKEFKKLYYPCKYSDVGMFYRKGFIPISFDKEKQIAYFAKTKRLLKFLKEKPKRR